LTNKLKASNTADEKLEDVVKSAQDAAVLQRLCRVIAALLRRRCRMSAVPLQPICNVAATRDYQRHFL
jgi:hypothetical protein